MMFQSKFFTKAVNESLKQEKYLFSVTPNKQKSFERCLALNNDLQYKLSCNFHVWNQKTQGFCKGKHMIKFATIKKEKGHTLSYVTRNQR